MAAVKTKPKKAKVAHNKGKTVDLSLAGDGQKIINALKRGSGTLPSLVRRAKVTLKTYVNADGEKRVGSGWVYNLLNLLVKRGLASKTKEDGKTVFTWTAKEETNGHAPAGKKRARKAPKTGFVEPDPKDLTAEAGLKKIPAGRAGKKTKEKAALKLHEPKDEDEGFHAGDN